MPRKIPHIQQKKLVFIAGEGLSERGYGRWLNHHAAEIGLSISIRVEALAGGDPCDLVEQSIEKLAAAEKSGARYRSRALLLDSDLRGMNIDRDQRAINLSARKNLNLIWQEPCHEGFLLRHFDAVNQLRPATVNRAEQLLARVWPQYEKGMDATKYKSVLSSDHLERARNEIPALNDFLRSIGWGRRGR
ncbi:MAG: hypothetical protein RIB59_15845 [Rhodospirillales bacterium]